MKTNKQKTRCHVVGVKKLRRRQREKEIKKQHERKKTLSENSQPNVTLCWTNFS